MEGAQGLELTDADLTGATPDRVIVVRAKLILGSSKLATAVAATPDQVYPLARVLALAQIARIATARFDY